MMANQYEHVRALSICVGCDGSKDVGLLLCWTCHHKQKARHDGSYSKEIEDKLAWLEQHESIHGMMRHAAP